MHLAPRGRKPNRNLRYNLIMKKLIIGGVPEHFNLPWQIAIGEKKFEAEGVELVWRDFPKGTGDLNRALRAKEIDLAVILTEGIVRDIVQGNPAKIAQVYVKSPLLWGIHVAAGSDYQSIADLKGTHAAISRYGSGSHLMAFVNAESHGWNLTEDLKFEVIDDLNGALKGLPEGRGDYFMWEKFMTKPYVDQGIFRRIGECPTPWPSFVIAARNDVLDAHEPDVRSVLKVINAATATFKDAPQTEALIAERFGQKPADVKAWLSLTQWASEPLTHDELGDVQEKLMQLGLIEEALAARDILAF
ncbi:ABC-type nitrate/sulfonate/bicarbonate transport system substrate-binding protein [Bradymonas sediminis]|nr:ABC-type nitrate/sulfonate/bicarbonate transport system substrate-binding protein [Bradymonas sediminis]